MSTQGDITGLLVAYRRGDPGAEERLVPVVYEELRRLARGQLRRKLGFRRPGATLDTTALAHEAYLKLFAGKAPAAGGQGWNDRGHFMAVAATAMRHILVDAAREKLAVKRGAGAVHEPLDSRVGELLPAQVGQGRRLAMEILDLDLALGRLGKLEPRQCRVVELHFFGGLTFEEAAETLGISAPTAKRDWWRARAFLYDDLNRSEPAA